MPSVDPARRQPIRRRQLRRPRGDGHVRRRVLRGDQRGVLRRGVRRVLYDDFGDFAVGYIIGLAWADAVQTALGSPLQGEARALASDCLVGAWIGTPIDLDSGPARPRRPRRQRRGCSCPPATSTRRSRPPSSSATAGSATTVRAAPSRRSRRCAAACSTACRRASPRSPAADRSAERPTVGRSTRLGALGGPRHRHQQHPPRRRPPGRRRPLRDADHASRRSSASAPAAAT